jgi:hypothetical protein
MVLIVYGRLATVDNNGAVAELVYAADLKSVASGYEGSSPSSPIIVVVHVYRV